MEEVPKDVQPVALTRLSEYVLTRLDRIEGKIESFDDRTMEHFNRLNGQVAENAKGLKDHRAAHAKTLTALKWAGYTLGGLATTALSYFGIKGF